MKSEAAGRPSPIDTPRPHARGHRSRRLSLGSIRHGRPVRGTATSFCAALLLGSAAPALAQTPAPPVGEPRVAAALAFLHDAEPATIEEQIAICEVPAPPFGEAARAEEYRRRLAAAGLRDVRIDEEGNVLGSWPGEGDRIVVLSGHLDTVFPEGTDVTVRRDGAVLHGPGILDDCRGLAILLAVARALREGDLRTDATLLFVATVGEEGEGDLRGVKHLFRSEVAGRIAAFVSIAKPSRCGER